MAGFSARGGVPAGGLRGHGWLAVVLAFAMAVLGLAAQPASAADGVAGDVSAQVVKDLTIEERWADGEITLWESLLATVTLDSRGATPDSDPTNAVDEGDWFIITFPEILTVPTETVELMQDGVALATCVGDSSARTLVCTFTAAAADRQFVEGSVEIFAQANQVTDVDEFVVGVGNAPVAYVIDIPGEGIVPGAPEEMPTAYDKDAWQDSSQPREIVWTVTIPANLASERATFTLADTTQGDGELMPYEFRLQYWADAAAWDAGTSSRVTIPAGLANIDVGGHTMTSTLTLTGANSFTLTFNNFDPGADGVYRIVYRTLVHDGAVTGQVFGNEAVTNGRDVKVGYTYEQFVTGNLNGPGFGGLVIDKQVRGAGAALALGQEFPVRASWVDAQGNTQTADLNPVAGGTAARLDQIPTGTVVTLTELPVSIDGVESYVPTFSSEHPNVTVAADGASAQVTIAEQATIALLLNNVITPVLVSIGDYVWWDHDRDGTQDATEPVVPGVTVTLLDATGAPVRDAAGNPRTTSTDADGFYSFTDLVAGTDYQLGFTAPDGASWTTQQAGTDTTLDSNVDPATGFAPATTPLTGENLAATPDDPTFDAGLVRYNLQLTKTLDTAGPFVTGQQVTYTLTPSNDGPSDALAGWSVTDLLPTGLELVSMTGAGYTCTAGTCTADAPLAAGATGPGITVVATITASAGSLKNVAYVAPVDGDAPETVPLDDELPTTETDTTGSPTDNDDEQVLVLTETVRVGDYVWVDADHDGVQDAGETPIPGATLEITSVDGGPVTDVFGDPVTTTTTGPDGLYHFENLPPGQYIVTFVSLPTGYAGYQPTLAETGDDRGLDSSTGSATSQPLAGGEEDLSLDFGFWRPEPVTVGDYVWVDADHDGIQDAGETPIPGVTLEITTVEGGPVTDMDGKPVPTTTTDEQGRYLFENLPPGQYIVKIVELPATHSGYLPTRPGVGDDRGADSSTDSATSAELASGDQDLSLDFGFWLPAPAITITKADDKGNAADNKDASVLLSDGKAKLVFTITNTGNEALRDVQVSDEVVRGGRVTNLVCVFPDGSRGVSWAGPFAIGASFQCTADLSGVSGTHEDIAKVVGIGVDSGKSVGDDDPYFAHTPKPGLPSTGADGAAMLAAPLLVLLAAGGVLLAGRRRVM